jgi:ElaB/YqjD/DUF883 family membrane-anchored ribosome-binding protein
MSTAMSTEKIRTMLRRLEIVRDSLASVLESAADKIEKAVESRPDDLAVSYAKGAAGLLDQAASSVKSVEPAKVQKAVQDQLRNNPGRSLAIAGSVGLLIGLVVRRR